RLVNLSAVTELSGFARRSAPQRAQAMGANACAAIAVATKTASASPTAHWIHLVGLSQSSDRVFHRIAAGASRQEPISGHLLLRRIGFRCIYPPAAVVGRALA